jgi:hypothetical protein
LQPDQKSLLVTLVEAARNLPARQRAEFILTPMTFGPAKQQIIHCGLPGGTVAVNRADIHVLLSRGLLIRLGGTHRSGMTFDIDPRGYQLYEVIKTASGEPVDRLETTVISYLNATRFRQEYPAAYNKWAQAEGLLWSGDSAQQLTSVGHLCREALQEFAASLAAKFKPSELDPDKAHTVARLRAILDGHKSRLGKTVQPFLDALLAYWGTLSDLVQRQEHGALREGEDLTFEDARRVVFHTAVVMFELDRSLSRLT